MADQNGDNKDTSVSATRGPAYPYVDLRKAVERVQVVADKGAGRQPMPPESFYALWNIGAKSSSARQTFAALNYYGLVDYIGRGNERRGKLTDLARRIVFDQREGSPERAAAIRQAALEPAIFRELYDRYGHITPADSVLHSYLMIERGFTKQGAEATADNYKSTFEFAGLGEPDKKSGDEGETREIEEGRGDARVGDLIDFEVGGVLANAEPLRVRALSPDQAWVFVDGSETGLPMEQVIVKKRAAATTPGATPPRLPLDTADKGKFEEAVPEGYRTEQFDTDEGLIKISWPSNLSLQSVEDMKEWLTLLQKRIERRAS
jgi:hypothetical protein